MLQPAPDVGAKARAQGPTPKGAPTMSCV